MKRTIQLLLGICMLTSTAAQAQEKIAVKNAKDLPKHSYSVSQTDVSQLVEDEEMLLQLATQLKSDILADLEKYDIQDNSSMKDIYYTLERISMLEGDFESAKKYITLQREYSEKEGEKHFTGVVSSAIISAYEVKPVASMDEKLALAQNYIEQYITEANFSVMQENIESSKGRLEFIGENIIRGFIEGQLQKSFDNNKGDIPSDLIFTVINLHLNLKYFLPLKEACIAAFANSISKYAEDIEKVDIWAERNMTFKKGDENLSTVIIGIWDSGTDVHILPKENVWMNSAEKYDGIDNDNNGYIDDVYGNAYNLDGLKDTSHLDPLALISPDIDQYEKHIKGILDIVANINSEEASALKKYTSTLPSEDVDAFYENLGLYGNYAHGTHVAGIAIEGNPYAKVLTSRITFDHKNIPDPPTDETVENWAIEVQETIDYFKAHNVRVVNMSWGGSYQDMVSTLELNGIGDSDEERKELAKKYFDKTIESLEEAIAAAPEILFVCAAGNSNDDVDFESNFPSGINRPNILTVGAVDIEGKKASFTTEGASVDVYANGYEVESYVPGGNRIKFSGTSMASPQVANLAGKMLSVNPDLTPEDIVSILIETATKSKEDEKVLLIDPKEAVQKAK